MSILIKGMEMPKSCWDCPMVSGYEIADDVKVLCSTVRCRLTNTKRPAGEAIAPDCPLVPVQPHGRLIDADEFLKRAIGTKCFHGDYALMLEELVGESTTIIPAEEGEA